MGLPPLALPNPIRIVFVIVDWLFHELNWLERKKALFPFPCLNDKWHGIGQKQDVDVDEAVAVLLTALPSRMYQCKSHASSNKWNILLSNALQDNRKFCQNVT